MNVSTNSFYYWLNKGKYIKEKEKVKTLKKRIKFHFENSKQIYGSCRIKEALKREGLSYSRSYIARLMKEMRLISIVKKQYVTTTLSDHSLPRADHLLKREFSTNKLGYRWVSDITYIKVAGVWNYLTTIIDLADRKLVGWSFSEDMTTQNTIKSAWFNAIMKRPIIKGFIFHSDQGVQYASKELTNIFNPSIKISQSMSRKGNCWDNAVAESFFKTIKYEWINRFKYENFNQAKKSIEEYIKWYNYERFHSANDYLTPVEMEMKLKGYFNKKAA